MQLVQAMTYTFRGMRQSAAFDRASRLKIMHLPFERRSVFRVIPPSICFTKPRHPPASGSLVRGKMAFPQNAVCQSAMATRQQRGCPAAGPGRAPKQEQRPAENNRPPRGTSCVRARTTPIWDITLSFQWFAKPDNDFARNGAQDGTHTLAYSV